MMEKKRVVSAQFVQCSVPKAVPRQRSGEQLKRGAGPVPPPAWGQDWAAGSTASGPNRSAGSPASAVKCETLGGELVENVNMAFLKNSAMLLNLKGFYLRLQLQQT